MLNIENKRLIGENIKDNDKMRAIEKINEKDSENNKLGTT